MKRRTFCVSSVALLAAANLPRARAASSDLPILSRLGKQLVLTGAEVDELRGALHGALLRAGDDGYEKARHIWNGAFDRHPAAIVRCADAADIATAVRFAASHDLMVAVRGGGHSLPGHSVCEGGLMIDLAPLRKIDIDATRRVARVEPGVLLGEMDQAAQARGLIVPAGTVSHTGVAGLTLGGGFGRLSRKLGLTIDSLLAAEVITAAGQRVRASEQENADLFWALRGGGGNFGVVASFEFRLHEVGTRMIGGDFVLPIAQARSALAALSDIGMNCSNDMWTDPVLECDADGVRRLMVNVCHSGTASAAEREIATLRKIGKPSSDTIGARAFTRLQSEHDVDSPHGRRYYMSGALVQQLPPALLDHAVASIQAPGAELGKISITQHGGAISSVAPTATAFANRSASHNVVVRAAWDDPAHAEARTNWQKETSKGVAPYSQGTYANLNFGVADPRIVSAYGPNLPRLVDLKTQYDPKNLFRLNPNIPPKA